jgi:cation:H+ antiporter
VRNEQADANVIVRHAAIAAQQRASVAADTTTVVQQVDRVYGQMHALLGKGKPESTDKAAWVLVLALAATLLLVLAASDAFTNAVEWLGAKLDLTRSAAGAVVAAIGSSLPESIVAIVALVVLRDARSQAIGIGAVLGAPLMLSTVVFCLIGGYALGRSGPFRGTLEAPLRSTLFGMSLFLCAFAVVLAASFVPSPTAHVFATVILLVVYAVYLAYHLRGSQQESEPSPPRLRIAPRASDPPLFLIVTQLVIALVVTVFASRWFVVSIGQAATTLRLAPFLVSLFLSPIATELPEATNVVTWMIRDEDSLALANVLGAMMFQTSIACSIALLATPWHLSASALSAGAAALLAVGVIVVWTLARRRLEPLAFVLSGVWYVAYLLVVVRLLH